MDFNFGAKNRISPINYTETNRLMKSLLKINKILRTIVFINIRTCNLFLKS